MPRDTATALRMSARSGPAVRHTADRPHRATPAEGPQSPVGDEDRRSAPRETRRVSVQLEGDPMNANGHARSILPIPDRVPHGLTTYDAKDPETKFAPIEPLLPPPGAPNVLIILLDDIGFGASSAFGGPCATPV